MGGWRGSRIHTYTYIYAIHVYTYVYDIHVFEGFILYTLNIHVRGSIEKFPD